MLLKLWFFLYENKLLYFAMDILKRFICYLAYDSGAFSICLFADNGAIKLKTYAFHLVTWSIAVFPNVQTCCWDGEYSHTSFVNYLYI
jgi:hypothetical protein